MFLFAGVHSVSGAQQQHDGSEHGGAASGSASADLGSAAGDHSPIAVYGRALGAMSGAVPDTVQVRSAVVVAGNNIFIILFASRLKRLTFVLYYRNPGRNSFCSTSPSGRCPGTWAPCSTAHPFATAFPKTR